MPVFSVRIAALLLGALTLEASAQKFEQVCSFPITSAPNTIGQRPYNSLTPGDDGWLYGTTDNGGKYDAGTAFRVSVTGEMQWMGDFNPSTTGNQPVTKLVNVGDGKLYGVTRYQGGSAQGKYGTLYAIVPSQFDSTSSEGALKVIYQTPGNLAPRNARALCPGAPGVMYVLCEDPSGILRVPLDGSTPSVLYTFRDKFTDGFRAWTLTNGGDGFLYGTTVEPYSRGTGTDRKDYFGTVFRIGMDGQGMTTLHEFLREEGALPKGSLVAGPNGFFYGMSNDGGGVPGNGTFYRIDRYGAQFKTLIPTLKNVLRYPFAELVYAPDGYFYGTSESGTSAYGAAFRVKPDGTGFKVLHSFTGKADGGYATGGLTLGPDGNLYGVTRQETDTSGGTVYRLLTKFSAPPANRAPSTGSDLLSGVDGSAPAEISVLANDYDPDGDALALAVETAPTFGTLQPLPGGVLRYTPGPGYDGSDSFTYSVSDGRGGTATGTVRISDEAAPVLLKPDLFVGLLKESAVNPQALLRVQLAAKGKFTGTLQTATGKLSVNGTLNANGIAAVPLALPNKVKGVIYLCREPGTEGSLKAILYGATRLEGLAGVAVPAGAKRAYTAAGFVEDPLPIGFGYATATMQTTGAVSFTGKLGDGTPLSWSTNLTRLPGGQLVVPVFNAPVAGGVAAGELTPLEGLQALDGAVRWYRPKASKATVPYADGFDVTMSVQVGTFTPPAANQPVLDLPAGTATVEGGPLAERRISGTFTLGGSKVQVKPQLKSLTLNRTTGAITGQMLIDKKAVSFTGAVSQGSRTGYGLFTIGGVSGTFRLEDSSVE